MGCYPKNVNLVSKKKDSPSEVALPSQLDTDKFSCVLSMPLLVNTSGDQRALSPSLSNRT